MAGIIAGNRPGQEGVAPGARLISIKTAGHDGITTVPQVVAAIDWVVEHRNTNGLNIRVLNLSLGLSGVDDHRGDLLSAAVERAWNAGIFVVVAAGNGGLSQKHLDSPAIDPYVLAVGGFDFFNENVPAWSANGNGARTPTSSRRPAPSPPTGCQDRRSTLKFRRPATAMTSSSALAPAKPRLRPPGSPL